MNTITVPETATGEDPTIAAVETLAHGLFADLLSPDGEVLGISNDVIVAPDLKSLLTDPHNTLVTLHDESQSLLGFSLAVPIDAMNPSRLKESAETAYIYFTGIEPDRQGEGLVASVMAAMVQQLRERGYGFVERDCMIDNGYAADVEKTYYGAIIKKKDYDPWGEGMQRFFRMDLSKMS